MNMIQIVLYDNLFCPCFRKYFNTKLFSEPEVVFIESVFGVFPASDHASAALGAFISQRSQSIEIWINRITFFPEINSDIDSLK